MRQYNTKISLIQNRRWIWDLDPFKWCYYWTLKNKRGCYWLCYAAKIAKFRWFDFTNVIYRDFVDDNHLKQIWRQLKKIEFVRLGTMCDPSHDWVHTINIINKIRPFIKNIVVITKHWTIISDEQLWQLNWICINTSISALDTNEQIRHRLEQYERLKPYCNSVLRVNTCDFRDNLFNEKKNIQEMLLKKEKVIDNILRMPNDCRFVEWWLVQVKKVNYLDLEVNASKHNKDIFMWYCKNCKEKCWINL